MNYLFDTDVISELLRRSTMTKLHQRIARVPARQQCTTAITLAELSCGAHKVGKVDLYARVRMILNDLEILTFDVAAAEEYGPLRARLEKKGFKLDEADLRIASIALAHGCTLVTGNVRHFARVEDLAVENWLKD
jgi:tRNA(fMet)-specific endonuclease VapC